jgi:hypothetical protein
MKKENKDRWMGDKKNARMRKRNNAEKKRTGENMRKC